jgi:hypothetical protein
LSMRRLSDSSAVARFQLTDCFHGVNCIAVSFKSGRIAALKEDVSQVMKYRTLVQLSALYDLLITFPFAFPKLCELQIDALKQLHDKLGLAGSIPDFHPIHYFFINLMGSLVVVWSALRIKYPQPILGLFDSFSRFMFSGLMLYYLLVLKVTGLLWFCLVPEIAWGVVQMYGYMRKDPGRSRA